MKRGRNEKAAARIVIAHDDSPQTFSEHSSPKIRFWLEMVTGQLLSLFHTLSEPNRPAAEFRSPWFKEN